MPFLSFQGKAVNFSETFEEVIMDVSAELLDEHLWKFGQDVALDVDSMIIKYTSNRNGGNGFECSIAQLAFRNALIATVIICLTN